MQPVTAAARPPPAASGAGFASSPLATAVGTELTAGFGESALVVGGGAGAALVAGGGTGTARAGAGSGSGLFLSVVARAAASVGAAVAGLRVISLSVEGGSTGCISVSTPGSAATLAASVAADGCRAAISATAAVMQRAAPSTSARTPTPPVAREPRCVAAARIERAADFVFRAALAETFLKESFCSLLSALSRYRTGDDDFLDFFGGTAPSSCKCRGGSKGGAPCRLRRGHRNPLQATGLPGPCGIRTRAAVPAVRAIP